MENISVYICLYVRVVSAGHGLMKALEDVLGNISVMGRVESV